MENASKALLIAAGMFFAILIVSLLVVLYNNISSYYIQKHETTIIEQTQKFNAKFENYHRNNIRGSDLISLMNRIIDYNATESYFDGNNYERIKVKITLGNNSILNQFKYKTDYETSKNKFLLENITNVNATGDNWQNDKKLIAITNTSSEMCKLAQNNGINNITDTKLQQLASKISNIFVDEEDNSQMTIYNRLYRVEMLEKLLGKDIIKVNEDTGKIKNTDTVSKNKLAIIKEIASQYYQYMQFKRAYFDCTEVKYDIETNRVVEMNFKLQTKILNGVQTVVFD